METLKGSRPGLLPGRNDPQPRGEGSASFDRRSQAVANWRQRKGMGDPRITWVRGPKQVGPEEMIGVLELKADGGCRAVFAERTEVDGRCHIRLARQAWGGKEALETRWWSLVLDLNFKVYTVRNGSCGDALLLADVPRVVRALEDLDLICEDTMLALDDAPPVLPRRKLPGKAAAGHHP